MTYRSDLTHAACEATISLDKALLLFARELEAHKELIEKLETQIQSLQALEMDRDGVANDHNIDARFDRIETRLDQVESDIENKLDSMDLDERVTETLQNVTFTVSVD
jgi:uncharacterized protein (DUF342 family)